MGFSAALIGTRTPLEILWADKVSVITQPASLEWCIVAKQIKEPVVGMLFTDSLHCKKFIVRIDASNIVRRFDYELSSIAAGKRCSG
jgi:hypothetical protein